MSVANAVGFASVSESQGFAFAVASETSLDAKRSVASKFFDWGCDAVQQARECPEAVRLSGLWMVQVVQVVQVQVVALDHSLRSTLGWFGVARIARANSTLKPMLRRYAAAARVPRLAAIWSARAR